MEDVSKYVQCEKHEDRRHIDQCRGCDTQCKTYWDQTVTLVPGKKQLAEDLDGQLETMRKGICETYYDMGEVLKQIRDEELFRVFGFKDLEEYAQKRHGFKYRKAAYLIAIVENCLAAGIPKEDIQGIEWSKMKELPVLTDENRKDWLIKARDMSVEELRHEVKKHREGGNGGDGEFEEKKSITFSLAPGQKQVVDKALELAARLTGSEVKSFHLQVLAEEFVGTYGSEDQASVDRFRNVYGEGQS